MQQVPEPDHGEWVARMRERARRDAEELLPRPPYHLTHLQEQAPWFTAEPQRRDAAIDETLRHAMLGEDVPSRAAQQAWARYWAHQMSLPLQEPGADLGPALAAGRSLVSAWLQAWSAWAGHG